MSRPSVLVTDAGRGSTVSIIRSLGRAGWRVLASDADASSLGFRSRHAAERLVYPPPFEAPARYREWVLDTVARERVDLFLPVTDAAMLPLFEARAELQRRCRAVMPDPEALRMVTDKEATLELAARLGVPAPRTTTVRSPEEASRVEGFGWPVVLKPKSSRVLRDGAAIESFEVGYANGPDELRARLAAFAGHVDVLVQEMCPGEGHGVGLLMHEGRPLAAFQHKRLHEVPPTGGPSSLRVGVPLDPALYEHSVRLLAAVQWTGLAMVEFKIGPRGPKLMEINGRVWGSLPLAVMSGVDFPRGLAELFMNGPPPGDAPPQLTYRTGIRARNLALEAAWFAAVFSGRRKYPFLPAPGRLQGVAGLFGLLDPRSRLDLFAWDDPGPCFAELPLIVAKMRRKRAARGGAN